MARKYGIDPNHPHLRTYRTGDLAFRRPDGTLPATYEVIHGHAWRAPADQGESALPAAALRRQR